MWYSPLEEEQGAREQPDVTPTQALAQPLPQALSPQDNEVLTCMEQPWKAESWVC